MSPALANRLVLILACAGIFIAFVTGLTHAFDIAPPCGETGTKGCEAILHDAWSKFLGIPTAFYGLALYLTVAVGALLRSAVGPENTPKIGVGMWVLLGMGTVVSVLLLGHAQFNIRATCLWCLASGLTMAAAFAVHTAGLAGKSGAPTRFNIPWRFQAGILGLALLAGGGYGWFVVDQGRKEAVKGVAELSTTDKQRLLRPDAPVFGDPDAPYTVVEFADLQCPACRVNHTWLKTQLETKLKGKVKLIFRHFPLRGQHEKALKLALYAELARDEGKFWQFVDGAYQDQAEVMTDEVIDDIAITVGIKQERITDLALNNPLQDRLLSVIQRDIADGVELGVGQTPTWFLIDKTGKVTVGVAVGIRDMVSRL